MRSRTANSGERVIAGPRTRAEIEALLDQLAVRCGDELEDQELDFKEWDWRSMRRSVRTVVDMAVCMANGGGGTVVFGVADEAVGRERAIVGVPPEVDTRRLRLAVYDSTDPKLTPVFEDLRVPEGTGRLILMHVHSGIPPYTDTGGRGTIRVGSNCKPLTGTLRRKLIEESGQNDYTATTIDVPLARIISPVSMESLRMAARRERAPEDLLGLDDSDLLNAIGVVRDGRPTHAAVLLAGSPSSIRLHVPLFLWTHVRMSSSTDYSDRADGTDAISVAVSRMLDRIMADNPIETVVDGPYHFEYRTHPEAALREALLNAVCHGDFRVAGPRLVKQYADRIEITSPGGLIGGITPDNILHHAPVTRNPCLVEALTRLRLVNRTNLGMERIFSALLMEGKSPPSIEDIGDSVRLIFRASSVSPSFRKFVADEAARGVALGADHLLVLRHLLREFEIDISSAARLCHRREAEAHRILVVMEEDFGHLERAGSESTPSWTLKDTVVGRLTGDSQSRRAQGHDRKSAKTRVLQAMRRRAARGARRWSRCAKGTGFRTGRPGGSTCCGPTATAATSCGT